MVPALIKPQVWQRWREAQRLALLATFEDSITGTRVKAFCRGLSRDLGTDCRIIEHVWLFNTFRLRELREIAAEEAAASDLIIISAHGAEALPDEVEGWIDLWVRPSVRHPAVLLALLDPVEEDASNRLQTHLQEIASRGGMELLVEAADET
jgi:hypothetical protein